jgi:hypothetical protein
MHRTAPLSPIGPTRVQSLCRLGPTDDNGAHETTDHLVTITTTVEGCNEQRRIQIKRQ